MSQKFGFIYLMSSPIKIAIAPDTYALVDEADAERVKRYRWSAYREHDGKIRAHANIVVNENRHRIDLGSFITQRNSTEIVRFRNNNPLDCRRQNLQVVARKTYLKKFAVPNAPKRADKASRYTGVRCIKGTLAIPRWEASIRPRGHLIYLGRYTSEEDAARAYDVAALQYYGSVAKLNFPERAGEPAPLPISRKPIYRQINCGRCGRPLWVTNPRQKNCRDGGCLRPVRDFIGVQDVTSDRSQ